MSFVKSQSKIDKTLLIVEGQKSILSTCLLRYLFTKQENELKKRQSHLDEFVLEFIDFYEKIHLFRIG